MADVASRAAGFAARQELADAGARVADLEVAAAPAVHAAVVRSTLQARAVRGAALAVVTDLPARAAGLAAAHEHTGAGVLLAGLGGIAGTAGSTAGVVAALERGVPDPAVGQAAALIEADLPVGTAEIPAADELTGAEELLTDLLRTALATDVAAAVFAALLALAERDADALALDADVLVAETLAAGPSAAVTPAELPLAVRSADVLAPEVQDLRRVEGVQRVDGLRRVDGVQRVEGLGGLRVPARVEAPGNVDSRPVADGNVSAAPAVVAEVPGRRVVPGVYRDIRGGR